MALSFLRAELTRTVLKRADTDRRYPGQQQQVQEQQEQQQYGAGDLPPPYMDSRDPTGQK